MGCQQIERRWYQRWAGLLHYVKEEEIWRELNGKFSNLNKNIKHVRATLKNNSGKVAIYLSLKNELPGACILVFQSPGSIGR